MTTNEVKVYSPQEVYDSHVYEILEGEELGYFINYSICANWQFDFIESLINTQTRVRVKLHGSDKISDNCVVIHVRSLWFDEIPIMVLLNSFDYENRCYESTYITNEEKYYEVIGYLHSLCKLPFSVINKDEKVLKSVEPNVDIYIQQVLNTVCE